MVSWAAQQIRGGIRRAHPRAVGLPTGGFGEIADSDEGSQGAADAASGGWEQHDHTGTLDRLGSRQGHPSERDVKQGVLANCPVAAILAALAHTAGGRKRIDSLITEYVHTQVKTTFSKEVSATLSAKLDDPDYKRPEKEILSKRYFSVNLGNAVEVSDVFYVKYSDGSDVDMIYMDSPKRALWPCVIEKAYAVKIGSYDDLDDDTKHTVNEFWAVLVGSKPDGFSINETTDLTKISAAAKDAGTIPTIAASKDDATKVTAHHGYAVMGIQGSTIELYNPYARIEKLSLQDFRSSFSAMFFGRL